MRTRSRVFGGLIGSMLLGLLMIALPTRPIQAQTNDELPVTVELTGVIVNFTVAQITLDNGIVLQIVPGTVIGPGVGIRSYVLVRAVVAADGLEVRSVELASGTPGSTWTPFPTGQPTIMPTITPQPTFGPTNEADCLGGPPHPVGQWLAEAFDVSYEELIAWKCAGFGFGEIARAYLLARANDRGVGVEEIFAQRTADRGWGEIARALGVGSGEIRVKVNSDGASEVEFDDDDNQGRGNNGNGNGDGDDDGGGDDNDDDDEGGDD